MKNLVPDYSYRINLRNSIEELIESNLNVPLEYFAWESFSKELYQLYCQDPEHIIIVGDSFVSPNKVQDIIYEFGLPYKVDDRAPGSYDIREVMDNDAYTAARYPVCLETVPQVLSIVEYEMMKNKRRVEFFERQSIRNMFHGNIERVDDDHRNILHELNKVRMYIIWMMEERLYVLKDAEEFYHFGFIEVFSSYLPSIGEYIKRIEAVKQRNEINKMMEQLRASKLSIDKRIYG